MLLRILAALGLAALLAACGADGAPTPPSDDADEPSAGITIGGSIGVGVAGGSASASIAD